MSFPPGYFPPDYFDEAYFPPGPHAGAITGVGDIESPATVLAGVGLFTSAHSAFGGLRSTSGAWPMVRRVPEAISAHGTIAAPVTAVTAEGRVLAQGSGAALAITGSGGVSFAGAGEMPAAPVSIAAAGFVDDEAWILAA